MLRKGKKEDKQQTASPLQFPVNGKADPVEAEARIDVLIKVTNKKPLSTDWAAIKYELKRLRTKLGETERAPEWKNLFHELEILSASGVAPSESLLAAIQAEAGV